MVVVKELKEQTSTAQESRDQELVRLRAELYHEAEVIQKLGDHPGVPLLFGIWSKKFPLKLIQQFHGERNHSITIEKTLRIKKIVDKSAWCQIISKTAEALKHIHGQWFLA